MMSIFFEDEEITENDLYYLCYMIERIARKLHQRNKYVVNKISKEEWLRLISLAGVLHCENPEKIEDEWIESYELEQGDFDVSDVNKELVQHIPTATQMGKVYKRLIVDTMQQDENFSQEISKNSWLFLIFYSHKRISYKRIFHKRFSHRKFLTGGTNNERMGRGSSAYARLA